MKNLLDFILRAGSWLLFCLYAVISCVLLFSANPYQHHVWLTSAGNMAGAVFRASNSVTGYFALRDINEDLQHRNAVLEAEVLALRQQVTDARLALQADTLRLDPSMSRYSFVLAHVINNSIHRTHNYITIEKGAKDGIRPEMGVVDQNGVVGIVNVVGPHTARIISVLNPHLRLSCKVKGSEHVGSLTWDGRSPREAILEELPRHAVFKQGDTIVTSGYSSAFPAGVPVGRVLAANKERDDNFYALRIELFTDFSTLSTVRVVRDSLSAELRTVEQDPDLEKIN